MAFLRDFRHKIAVLKSQGLIPDDVDARSAYPSWKRNGKKLSTIVDEYDAVASGKATAVKVPSKILRKYRKLGRETAGGRVIEPHGLEESARFDPKSGAITIKHKSGIERIQIPIEFHNLEQWTADIKKNKRQINALKSGRESFGFRYYGNNGSEFFNDIGLFVDFIRSYESFQSANTSRKAANVYKNIEILRVNYQAMREWITPSERTHERTKEYARKVARRFRKNLKKKSKRKQDEYLDAAAERMRRYRARMTKAEKKAANEKARRRMKKLKRKR